MLALPTAARPGQGPWPSPNAVDDVEYQLRALWGLWLFHVNSGRHRIPLELAERFLGLAPKRPASNDPLFGKRMIGVSLYLRGDLAAARDHLERVLAEYVASDDRSQIIRFQFDLLVSARVFIAWILWLQGLPDQAIRVANSAVEDARTANHALSLCYALAFGACPIAFLIGDLTAAEQYVSMLVDQSTRYALALWGGLGRAYQGLLLVKQGGDDAAGAALAANRPRRSRRGGGPRCAIDHMPALVDRTLAPCRSDRPRTERARGRNRSVQRNGRILGNCRVTACQRRVAAVAGCARSGGNGGGTVPAGARLGAPAGRAVLGIARRHKPRPAVARSGPSRGGSRDS